MTTDQKISTDISDYPYANDAVLFFLKGDKSTDNCIVRCTRELQQRTHNGDTIYIELSKLMLEYEYSIGTMDADELYDLNNQIRDIVGPENPNNNLE